MFRKKDVTLLTKLVKWMLKGENSAAKPWQSQMLQFTSSAVSSKE
jgi:hypothetical protein